MILLSVLKYFVLCFLIFACVAGAIYGGIAASLWLLTALWNVGVPYGWSMIILAGLIASLVVAIVMTFPGGM